MKVWASTLLQSVTSLEELRRFVTAAITNFGQILTGNVTFGDNIKCQIVEVNYSAAGSKVIPHNLGVVPAGFLVINCDSIMNFGKGTSAWTSSQIDVYSDAAGDAKIIILGG